MNTSTKARLTSVMIWIQICIHDPDCHQNTTISSLANCQPSLKISCKSVWKLCTKLLRDRQTDKQDNNISSLAEVTHSTQTIMVYINLKAHLSAATNMKTQKKLAQHLLNISPSVQCNCYLTPMFQVRLHCMLWDQDHSTLYKPSSITKKTSSVLSSISSSI